MSIRSRKNQTPVLRCLPNHAEPCSRPPQKGRTPHAHRVKAQLSLTKTQLINESALHELFHKFIECLFIQPELLLD